LKLREIKRFQRVRFVEPQHCSAGRVVGMEKIADNLYQGWYEGWEGSGAFNYVPDFDGEAWLDLEVVEIVDLTTMHAADRKKWDNIFEDCKTEYKGEFVE
jgi:hypothetical protein